MRRVFETDALTFFGFYALHKKQKAYKLIYLYMVIMPYKLL